MSFEKHYYKKTSANWQTFLFKQTKLFDIDDEWDNIVIVFIRREIVDNWTQDYF